MPAPHHAPHHAPCETPTTAALAPTRGARALHASPGSEATLRALFDGLERAAPAVLKRDGDEAALLIRLGPEATGEAVVLKRFKRRTPFASRATRQRRGALRLARAGIPTALPFALLAERGFVWLALPYVPGADLLNTLAKRSLDPRDERRAARRAGALARAHRAAGLFNRDLKLSNIVRSEEGGLVVIDTLGVRPRPPRDALRRMLLSMLKEAEGTGVRPRRSVLCAAVTEAAGDSWKDEWRALQRALAASGDNSPRVDPIET